MLAKENASKRPHKTAVMTEELEVERYSDAKKARVAGKRITTTLLFEMEASEYGKSICLCKTLYSKSCIWKYVLILFLIY